jgi:PAS domain S-box-containing protein
MNDAAESLTGWTAADARGQPLERVFQIINEDSRQAVTNPATRALHDGVVVGLANHTVLVRKDGSECPIDDSEAPILDENGQVSGCVLIFRGVSVQRRLDQSRPGQLRATAAAIVESSDDAIISKTLQGTIQSWNAAAERVFGHRAETAIGQHISLVIPPERIAEEDQIIERLKLGERIEHFETERLRADGQRIPVSLTISPIRNDAGEVVGASKVARDVTRQRQAEAEREKFVTLVETSTDFVAMFDLQGMPFFVNRAGLLKVGLDDIDAARRTPLAEFFFPEDRRRIIDAFLPSVLQSATARLCGRNFETEHYAGWHSKCSAQRQGWPVDRAGHRESGRDRAQAPGGQPASTRQRSVGGRPPQGRVPRPLAHELRNPLAPLSNMLAVMQRRWRSRRGNARDTMQRQLASWCGWSTICST